MAQPADAAHPIIRPPIAWAVAFLLGLGLDWLYPLPFVPESWPRFLIGAGVFALAFALAIWAITTFRAAGTRIDPGKPTSVIVTNGPFRFSRNPIYVGMLLGQTGLAIGFDNAWILASVAPLYLVLRFGVVAREEAYLERTFGSAYIEYKSRVRRWL
jgi:protein-S-isoprenylcysteine O-methyltransferase Ste14